MKRDECPGHAEAARPLPVCQAETGGRRVIAALKARLMKMWVGLYAPPPRRPGPML